LLRAYKGKTAVSQDNISKPKSPVVPVTVAGVLAVLGVTGFIFSVRTPTNNSEAVGGGMISAAAVDRAGATEVPSSP
jgi:hypothetical protein